MKFLLNMFRSTDDDTTLDHVPVRKKKDRDWRDAAVKKAAAKYGKPFACGPETLPRQVMLEPGKYQPIEGGVEAKKPKADLIAPFTKRAQA